MCARTYVVYFQAVFTGAIVPSDQREIMQLLRRAIVCLVNSSTDEQHPGVRYARMLNGLMRMLSKSVDDAVPPREKNNTPSAVPTFRLLNGDSEVLNTLQRMPEQLETRTAPDLSCVNGSGGGGGGFNNGEPNTERTDVIGQISPSSFAGLSHELQIATNATDFYSDLLADNELEADFWKLVVPNEWS
jgi:hypothetical protein